MTAHKHAALFRAIADGDDLRKWECLRDTWGDDWSDIEQGRLAGIAHQPDEWQVRRKPDPVKTETRTYECWAHVDGGLHWREEGSRMHWPEQWNRVPSLDKACEVVL